MITPTTQQSTKRVLVVDDTYDIVSLLEIVLAHHGYEVVSTDPSNVTASPVETVSSARPDVMILDLHMRDVNGWDILELLRADTRTADLPVIVSTADERALKIGQPRARALRAETLARPFQVDSLLAAVKRALSADPLVVAA